MTTKRNGLILAGLGIVVILFALLAHTIGIGPSGFGVKHIAALVVGIALAAVGTFIALRAQGPEAGPATPPQGAA